MTTHTETWATDQCTCRVSMSWDDATFPTVFSLVQYLAKCPIHTALSDTDAFSCIWNENMLASNAMNACMASAPTGTFNTNWTTETWAGTAPNRTLTITFDTDQPSNKLSTNQVATMQSAVNTAVGLPGLVTITTAY